MVGMGTELARRRGERLRFELGTRKLKWRGVVENPRKVYGASLLYVCVSVRRDRGRTLSSSRAFLRFDFVSRLSLLILKRLADRKGRKRRDR